MTEDSLQTLTVDAGEKAGMKLSSSTHVPRTDAASDSTTAPAATNDRPSSSSASGFASKLDRPVKKAEIKVSSDSTKRNGSTATVDLSTSKDSGPLYDSASRRFLRYVSFNVLSDRWQGFQASLVGSCLQGSMGGSYEGLGKLRLFLGRMLLHL